MSAEEGWAKSPAHVLKEEACDLARVCTKEECTVFMWRAKNATQLRLGVAVRQTHMGMRTRGIQSLLTSSICNAHFAHAYFHIHPCLHVRIHIPAHVDTRGQPPCPHACRTLLLKLVFLVEGWLCGDGTLCSRPRCTTTGQSIATPCGYIYALVRGTIYR